ncbi:TetR family transcriptional regulator C-terminal domain-containing protein [Jannaschia ovalis]|uniref:TetR family transcriptional regulator C-terminal domain-containing protein n=1 Tax=Jannaschia ovalis TaxID=3038773 RepID=A0ABY8L952_9RHOB|nr:TetR family transcriptional regulator C-terminal domain-containing protein [Jannaschia sp. GRR-S6-38]WGH77892.1 TetR family transcriptional regulator C-terminal domain-containing protein [Jannaschia sp. GRR-S6-38]
MANDQGRTRIQRENRARILEAGLEVFSSEGFRGATLDGLAQAAGLSKPNMLYYFASKEAIYVALLDRLLDAWLDPLRALDPAGEPLDEMLGYVRRKLHLARDYPRESRLFAGEVLRGAEHIGPALSGGLRWLVDDRAAVIGGWMAAGRLAPSDPHHLIVSIWALTQHYADFEVQVRAVLGEARDPWAEAERELELHFRRVLAVG